jgi:peptide/nickel transport system substrate-binding protein
MTDLPGRRPARPTADSALDLRARLVSRRQLFGMGGALAAGVGLAPVLAACGTSGSSSAAGGSGKSGGTLTMGINAPPDTLDPGATGLALTLMLSMAMFDPLVWWLPDATGSGTEFVPGLAESYSVNADASVFTFKLKKGVTFHDGTKFDATAVKATYDHIVDPATKSKSGLGALGPYQETKIIDPYTVQIVFSKPNAGFLHQQAAGNFGIASPAALKKYGPTGFGSHPVGTGPFKFESYATGSQLNLVKNDAYTWGPDALSSKPPKLDKLIFRIVTDDSGRYSALQSGQLQIALGLPPNDISAAQKSGQYKQLTVQAIGTPLGFPINVTKAPTNDPLVRQAIMYAVDQEKLVNQVLFGVDTPAHTVLTPITPGYSAASAKLYSYDPDKSKALLDQAGWKVGPGGVRTKNGQKLFLKIILFSDSGLDLPTEFVASELSKIGFTSSTTVQPFTTAQGSFNAGLHNLGAFGYYGTDPYLLNIWVNSDAIKSGFNWSHYSNPKVDAMIAQANATADAGARNALYEQVCVILMKDAMYLPLWNVNEPFTMSPSVAGLHSTLNGYVTFHSASV